MKHVLYIFLFFITVVSLQAEEITWVGGSSNDNFHNSQNWSPGIVPSEIDDVVIPEGSEVTIAYDVKVNSFENRGKIKVESINGEELKIETVHFHNYSEIVQETVSPNGMAFRSGVREGATWTNNGTIKSNKMIQFMDGTKDYQAFAGSITNEGVLSAKVIYMNANNLNNQNAGVIECYSTMYLMVDNLYNSSTIGYDGDKTEFAPSFHFYVNDKFENGGNIEAGSANEKDTYQSGGDVEIRCKSFLNDGAIIAGNGYGNEKGGNVIIKAKDFAHQYGTVKSGDGAGKGSNGFIEMRCKDFTMRGKFQLGWIGEDSQISENIYIVSDEIKFKGKVVPTNKLGGIAEGTGKDDEILDDEPVHYTLYLYGKKTEVSAAAGDLDLSGLVILGEEIVFKDIETGGIKCVGQVNVSVKDGGSSDFSTLTNPNSVEVGYNITITNTNVSPPGGGWESVFNKAPELQDPGPGWSFFVPQSDHTAPVVGRPGVITISLMNFAYENQDITIKYESENGWVETGETTINVGYLSLEEIEIPFNIPNDVKDGTVDKFTYTMNYGGQDYTGESIDLVARGSGIIDLPQKIDLVYPVNNATQVPLQPELNWDQTDVVDFYTVEMATDENFENSIIRIITEELKLLFDEDLNEDTEFFWHVRPNNGGGAGPWSDTWSFTTMKTTSVELIELSEQTKVYPNPASQLVNLEFEYKEAGMAEVVLYDMSGKKVMNYGYQVVQDGLNKLEFDLSGLISGRYTAVIRFGEKYIQKSFIVE